MKNVFKLLGTSFWKNRKHNEMLLDTSYIPSSCRKSLPLNVLPDVMESEGVITLEAPSDNQILTLSYPYIATRFPRGIMLTK